MIDDIVIAALVLLLVFCAGLYWGSKRPVYRRRRQLAELNRQIADSKAELSAVTPLKVRAHQLHLKLCRLDYLSERRNGLDTAIGKLDTAIGFAEFQLDHRTPTVPEHAKLTRELTTARAQRSLLCGQRVGVITDLTELTQLVNEESAALEDARMTAMVDRGLGHIEEVHATMAA